MGKLRRLITHIFLTQENVDHGLANFFVAVWTGHFGLIEIRGQRLRRDASGQTARASDTPKWGSG